MKNLIASLTIIFIFYCAEVLAVETTGNISGIVNHCDKGGIEGMMVYIPGKSHVVITGTDGKFFMSRVPAGDYTIYFMVNGNIMGFNKWTDVKSGETSSLGLITFCDKIATSKKPARLAVDKQSTNKTSATIPPNLNDHCKNEKDGTLVPIINGAGVCKGGAVTISKCNKGFSSCDENILNGCETNIITNDEHCGSCFNACSDLDSCNEGFC